MGRGAPAAIADWRYLGVSILAGLITFFWYSIIDRLHNPVLVFDGAGLALFAVAGAQKALVYGLNPVMAALLGMPTGSGGGMLRDVFVTQIPAVTRRSLCRGRTHRRSRGGIGHGLQLSPTATTSAGTALCFGLRLPAIRRGWHLPVARTPQQPAAGADAQDSRNDKNGL